ncbi:30S ribosomal protein S5 [Candidatus Woesearchaeota archaeon]|nr:30S ribosomal protein S5 [Candidatus Woesearchaeota archaeon]
MAEQSQNRRGRQAKPSRAEILESWQPKTEVGRLVKSGEIKDLADILKTGKKVLEAEIVDSLLPELESDLLMIGQSKGKFGGGQRRAFRQTQKKQKEGARISFTTMAVAGNRNGFVGIGLGKARETIPAREKAFRNSKLNMMMIRRGCGDWKCSCGTPHSIPFAVTGKCSSVELTLMPAPKGTGLCVEKECQKILALAGIKDVWSKTKGQTKVKLNLVAACEQALKKMMLVKVSEKNIAELGIIEGMVKKQEQQGEKNE